MVKQTLQLGAIHGHRTLCKFLKCKSKFLGALTDGLESATAPRGSDADSRGSNWTRLESATDSIWVEPRRIHQVRHALRRGSNLVPCTFKVHFWWTRVHKSTKIEVRCGVQRLPRTLQAKSTADFSGGVRGLRRRLVHELRHGLIFSSAADLIPLLFAKSTAELAVNH